MPSIHQYAVAEQQLISTVGWFRSRYTLFLGFSIERKADRQRIKKFGQI